MFEGLAIKAIFGGIASKAKSAWSAIPPKVKLILLAIVAAVALIFLHQWYADRQLKAADQAGYDRAKREDQAAMTKARTDAAAWKQKADVSNGKIKQKGDTLHDQAVTHNRALADDLRLRVGTKVQPSGRSGPGMPGVATAAGRPDGSQPYTDAGLAEQATATVPALDLINYAEQCDNDHDARIRIEDAWDRYKANWPTAKGP